MRVLEIGTYVVPAYAGMILAEQGHEVTKWLPEKPDPIQGLRQGEALWAWINHGKILEHRHAKEITGLEPGTVDAVIDNVRLETWQRWGIDPCALAERSGARWASMRDDLGGRSFDVIAQARAWGDHASVPFYLGDTAGGLWLAFKLLNLAQGEHAVVHQAAALAKLVEGELVVPVRRHGVSPWDKPGTYGIDPFTREAMVCYRDQWVTEPARDDAWRRANLRHSDGRYVI